MFVSPFWSCKPVEDGQVLITNQMDRTQMRVPSEFLGMLAAIYSDQKHDSPRSWVARAMERALVFSDIESAHANFREQEHAETRSYPLIEQIELTNRCPYTCKMCPRTMSMDRPLGNMDINLFERIIGQMRRNQQYVALHHFGESLIYPELPAAVRIASRMGIACGLSCNPPSLNPKLAAALLDAGIANLVLSLDALDTQTYREIRGAAAQFERADLNIRELVRLRDQGSYLTFLTLQMISMHCNHRDADRFLEYCRETAVDRGVVIRLGRWDFGDEYVKDLGEFTSPGYLPYCSRPWKSLVVLWDGRVVPCCHDYNGEVVLGDLREQSLEEIWDSARTKGFRAGHYDSNLCRKCAFSLWSREQQRKKEGFAAFHRERAEARREWLNPSLGKRLDGRALFDGFEIENT